MLHRLHKRGFTIVELLIVIVVIVILAAITIVAYTGVQENARFSRAMSDMKHINDAIIVYKAQNGSYPVGNDTFQPASSALSLLAPNYLDSANILTAETGYFYIYRADPSGLNYKLLRGKGAAYHGPVALDSIEVENNDLLNVPSPLGNYGNKTWGYWSPGAVNWAS